VAEPRKSGRLRREPDRLKVCWGTKSYTPSVQSVATSCSFGLEGGGGIKDYGIGTRTPARTRTHMHMHRHIHMHLHRAVRNGTLCVNQQAGLLYINLRPGGSFGARHWPRPGRLVGGEARLAAWQRRHVGGPLLAVGGPLLAGGQPWCVGGPLLASWPRDPWLGPEHGSQEEVFARPGSRPEALLKEAERIRCRVQPHVIRGRTRCQARPRTRAARCQVHPRADRPTGQAPEHMQHTLGWV